MKDRCDVLVVGGGPAGLAATIKASELGLNSILVENRERLGGVPLQCIHPGFGLHYFGEDLTGTELIYRLLEKFMDLGIEYYVGAHVADLNLSFPERRATIITRDGVLEVDASAIIYATGARERHVFDIWVTGHRPAGVYTAGEAQAMMDVDGVMPGREILIVGSGDVGLIMARRFALEGARVKAVVETLPYPGGLLRNVVQCLHDYGIPLLLETSVIEIHGRRRVEEVVVSKVDAEFKPVPGTERTIKCDTVIIAAGLRPYIPMLEEKGVIIDSVTGGPVVNDYLETSMPGVFVCGNALLINDLVDYVLEQGEQAAEGAYLFVKNGGIPTFRFRWMLKGRNIRFVVPHYLSGVRDVTVYARVMKPIRNVAILFPEIDKHVNLPVVRPAEMIRVKLRKDEISKTSGKITMEAVPRG